MRLSRESARLAAIAGALFANAFAMANPFPYSPFLVMHFGLSHDERALGFYAGFVISAFMFGRIFGSYPLGALADRWGRRRVIELGLVVSCVLFQLAFALAPTFGAALAFRFLMGLTNGIIGVAKAWLPELASPSRQAFAMSIVAGMWGVGLVAGPAVGGLLYGRAATSGLLHSFPQLLPNVIGAAIAVGSVASVRLFLPMDGPVRRVARRGSDGTVLVTADSARAVEIEATEEAEEAEADSAGRAKSRRRGGLGGLISSGLGVPRSSYSPLLVYCLVSLFSICYAEAYPLWLIAPTASGGLGWSPAQVGAVLSCDGAFVAAANFVVFPWLATRWRMTSLFRVCCAGSGIVFAVTPLLGRLSGRPDVLMPLLLLHMFVKTLCNSTLFTVVFLIINNSCMRSQRGRVNGLGMTFSSGFKAVGPTLGAISFAWSLTNGLPPPFDVHFTFFMSALLAFASLAVAHVSFSPRNDSPLEEEDDAAEPPPSDAPPAPVAPKRTSTCSSP